MNIGDDSGYYYAAEFRDAEKLRQLKRCTCAAHSAAECLCGAWSNDRRRINTAFVDGLRTACDRLSELSAKYQVAASEGKLNSIKRNRNNWKVDAINEAHRDITEVMRAYALQDDHNA